MIMQLIDMAKSPEQVEEESKPYEPGPENVPKYPYGLCLYLDEEALARLGLDGDADVGDGLHFMAMAKVTSASATEKADGSTCRRVELQITHMALGEDHNEKVDRYGTV